MALSLMLAEDHEFSRMCINSIKSDLLSNNEASMCLALAFAANLGSAEYAEALVRRVGWEWVWESNRVDCDEALVMMRGWVENFTGALVTWVTSPDPTHSPTPSCLAPPCPQMPDLERIATQSSQRPVIRKKAALTLAKFARRAPDAVNLDLWRRALPVALETRDLGILLTLATLLQVRGRTGSCRCRRARRLVATLGRQRGRLHASATPPQSVTRSSLPPFATSSSLASQLPPLPRSPRSSWSTTAPRALSRAPPASSTPSAAWWCARRRTTPRGSPSPATTPTTASRPPGSRSSASGACSTSTSPPASTWAPSPSYSTSSSERPHPSETGQRNK